MPTAGVIATQLTDHATVAKTLTVGGYNVMSMVDIDSVRIDEQGPGGVSSMSFDIWDQTGAVSIQDGQQVEFWDVVRAAALFAGFVQSWSQSPAFGGQGRIIRVVCVGAEAILDWTLMPEEMTFPAGALPAVAVQSLVANSSGTVVGLNTAMVFFGGGSTTAHPISASGTTTQLPYAVTVAAGISLREAIATVCAPNANTRNGFNIKATIDFTYGLRLFIDAPFGGWADDYADLTVTDTLIGTVASSRLEHETNADGIVRGVFIKGADAAGTGFLGDGSGKPGRVAYFSDDTIDTAAKLLDAQQTYLNANVLGTRGSLDLTGYSPTTNVRPGSLLVLTDAGSGATGSYHIYGIRKTFNVGGTQNWSIAYGGFRPSAVRATRRLIATPRA